MFLAVIFGLLLPRLAIAYLWFMTKWFFVAFRGDWIIPLLGFIFLPYTLLWYAAVYNWYHGVWGIMQIVILIAALVIDLGSYGSRNK
ncbi:MAG TPA: hypothetical protein PKM84_02275 [Candidatus Pacearchaeota archaeon]|nr:hypothetical protein [Candidatus Pacearchaeota archaeon]